MAFAYDSPNVWNELQDDICSAASLLSFQKRLKAYLFTKANHPRFGHIFPLSLYYGPLLLCLSTVNSLDLFSWLLSLRVCLLMENSAIKVRLVV